MIQSVSQDKTTATETVIIVKHPHSRTSYDPPSPCPRAPRFLRKRLGLFQALSSAAISLFASPCLLAVLATALGGHAARQGRLTLLSGKEKGGLEGAVEGRRERGRGERVDNMCEVTPHSPVVCQCDRGEGWEGQGREGGRDGGTRGRKEEGREVLEGREHV